MKKSAKTLRLNRDVVCRLESNELKSAGGHGVKNTLTACDGFAGSGCPHTCLC